MTGRYSFPANLLRLEGLAALIASVALYARQDASWLWFVVLLMAPDLSGLGLLSGFRLGSITYNIAHTYALPAILGLAGLLGAYDLAVSVALIWTAHVGMDRILGYGLTYPSGFKDTHLPRV